MKKFLTTILLSSALAFSPLTNYSQEVKPREYNYEIFLENGFNLGKANCSSEKIDFNLKGIHHLTFEKKGNTYTEKSKFLKEEEKYIYSNLSGKWKFINFVHPEMNSKEEIEKRKDKYEMLKKSYSKNILLGVDIFKEFNKKTIPDSLEILVFSHTHKFVLDKIEGEDIIKVSYNYVNYKKFPSDKIKINSLVYVLLKKDKEGNFYTVGGEAKITYVGWLFNFNLNLEIKEVQKD